MRSHSGDGQCGMYFGPCSSIVAHTAENDKFGVTDNFLAEHCKKTRFSTRGPDVGARRRHIFNR